MVLLPVSQFLKPRVKYQPLQPIISAMQYDLPTKYLFVFLRKCKSYGPREHPMSDGIFTTTHSLASGSLLFPDLPARHLTPPRESSIPSLVNRFTASRCQFPHINSERRFQNAAPRRFPLIPFVYWPPEIVLRR
jgi:hypothetical protein